MGFYLRKSFRAGPLRLNLSKSGLGVSAGVKGFRVGSGPRGGYVHAGRGGLYYRQSLGKGSRTSKTQPEAHGCLLLICVGVAVWLAILVVEWFVKNPVVFWAIIVVTTAVFLSISYRSYAKTKAFSKFKTMLDEIFILNTLPPTPENLQEVRRLRSGVIEHDDLRPKIAKLEADVYHGLLDKIIDDKAITPEEKDYIEKLESLMGSLDEAGKIEIKKDIFHSLYLEAIEDRKITPEEITTLKNIGWGLGLTQGDLEHEMSVIDEIRRMQDLALPLTPLDSVPVKIQKSEVPYYVGHAKILSRKKTSKGDDSGYDYSVQRDGDLVITDKRVLVVDQGTTAVKLSEILDVDVDLDKSLIVVSKGSSSRPVLIQTAEPLYCGRVIDLLSGTSQ